MTRRPAVAELRHTRFDSPRFDPLGIEVMTLSALRAMASPAWWARPERVDFTMVCWVTRGRGWHTVDFRRHALSSGTLLIVRAGQVQQWHWDAHDLEGVLVLAAPAALQPQATARDRSIARLLRLEEWPTATRLAPPARAALDDAFERLRRESDGFDQRPLSSALIRQMFGLLLLQLARELDAAGALGRAAAADAAAYALLRRELDASLHTRPSVRGLARRLGYSVSTLNRACLAAAGCTAKQLIDRRIALEAQRLLVHTDTTVAGIAQQLGFSEATNFLKFFRRMAGGTPLAFRRFHLPDAAHGPPRRAAAR